MHSKFWKKNFYLQWYT